MTGTARPLVGRDSELELLDRRLHEACAGAPRFVVVHGEAGIGKTSLLSELGRKAEQEGCLVLEGRATELERELPFAPFVDALDAYLDGLEARIFERLPPEDLGELAAVFPALRSLAPATGSIASAAERYRAHHAVRELLERLAVRQPIVLALDDLHWSDGASIELIAHLLRRPPDAPVLLVGAHRTGREDRALAAALEAAAREGRVEHITLGPLDRPDAERLLGGNGPADRDRLFRESGGNPFFLLELARHHPGHGPVAFAERDAEGVPAGVSAAIAGELEALSPDARHLAQAAAVAGEPFELDLAIAAAGMPEYLGLHALDELIACDLVRRGEVPRRFRFRHPLVRSAVYASCSVGLRLTAHERAAQVLAERGAPAAARAHHVELCARHGDLAAVEVLREAGTEVAARAPHSAASWLAAALRMLPPSAGPAARGELLQPLAIALAATGRLEEARAALVETLALGVDRPGAPRVALVSACANLEQLLGRRDEARARLTEALSELDQPVSGDGAALMISLALDRFLSMDFSGMVDWAERAVAVTETLEDRSLAAAAVAMLAFAEANAGALEAADRHCSEAAALVDAMDDGELGQRVDAIAHLAGAEYVLERLEDAVRHGRRGVAVASSTGQGDFFPTLISALGGALFLTGRLEEAAEQLDAAVEAARLSDNAMALGLALLNCAYTTMMLGDVDGGLRRADEAVAVTRRLPGSVTAAWASAVHALVLYESGEHVRAVEAMRRAGGERLERIPGGMRSVFLEVVVRSLLALGRHDEAAQAADDAVVAAPRGRRFAAASAQRSQAAVALASGDAATAARLALASAQTAATIGARVEIARSRLLAGEALAAAGREHEAVEQLEQAAEGFESCGAARHRAQAVRELRKLGRTVHRRARPGRPDATGVASLTGRELEIARLVVDRRTNPEIAAELFLSIKTVESHLRNIFRKLGVSSRVEVARVLERAATRHG